MADLVDERHAASVAAALIESGAFTVDMGTLIRWKSGILAPCGCNCRRINTIPRCRRLIDDALTDAARTSFPDADYVVAVANAGIAWAKTIAERLDLPLAYVRTEAREPGGPLVECGPSGGTRVVIVEDVVASGDSTNRAIRALLAETDLRVTGLLSIANWDFPEMRIALGGWPVRALTGYRQVLAAARDAGLINGAELAELTSFYADPRHHQWRR
jgi:orotate phosphoribosyltransferase